MPQYLFFVTESKDSTHKVKMCSLLYNLLYQFSQFPVSMEHSKLQKQKIVELLSLDNHRTP